MAGRTLAMNKNLMERMRIAETIHGAFPGALWILGGVHPSRWRQRGQIDRILDYAIPYGAFKEAFGLCISDYCTGRLQRVLIPIGDNMAYTITTRFRTVLSVLLFCTLAGTAVAIDLPSIAVDKLEDDFGDVHVGRKVEKRIAVTNKGTAPLAIEYIETTCGCTKAVAENTRINPGEQTDVVVSYDTVGLGWGKSTQAVRINTNDPKRPVVSVRFFANILHEVVLDPQNLVTKLPEIKNPLTFSVLAKNRSDKPIVLQLLKTRGAIAKAVFKPETVTIAPGAEERFSIEVILSDEEKRPSYRGAVFVATDHAEEKEIILPCLIKTARKR